MIRQAALIRAPIGWLRLARITRPGRCAGMSATSAPKPLVEPVLLIQTFSRGRVRLLTGRRLECAAATAALEGSSATAGKVPRTGLTCPAAGDLARA